MPHHLGIRLLRAPDRWGSGTGRWKDGNQAGGGHLLPGGRQVQEGGQEVAVQHGGAAAGGAFPEGRAAAVSPARPAAPESLLARPCGRRGTGDTVAAQQKLDHHWPATPLHVAHVLRPMRSLNEGFTGPKCRGKWVGGGAAAVMEVAPGTVHAFISEVSAEAATSRLGHVLLSRLGSRVWHIDTQAAGVGESTRRLWGPLLP